MKDFDKTPSWGRSREMSLRDKEKHRDECEDASWECPHEKGYCLEQTPFKDAYVCGRMIKNALELEKDYEIPSGYLEAYIRWFKDDRIKVPEKNKP